MTMIVENKQLNRHKLFYLPMSLVFYGRVCLLSLNFCLSALYVIYAYFLLIMYELQMLYS